MEIKYRLRSVFPPPVLAGVRTRRAPVPRRGVRARPCAAPARFRAARMCEPCAPDALLEAVRGLRVAEPDLGLKPLLAKLREQRPELGAATKEVREALATLKAESEAAAKVAARNGTLKEAWDAVRTECDCKFKDYAIYEHCLPFNVSRAYDEARGIDSPRIWTAERDLEMWEALQA